MARADVIATNVSNGGAHYTGGGTTYIIQKNGSPDTFYIVLVDNNVDVVYTKSTDGGFTWATPVSVRAGTVVAVSCWYDRWSGISGDVIHIAYIDANSIFYRSLDISSDTLGTETTVLSGTSSAAGGALTIWRSRASGTIRVAGSIDAGAEDGAWSSTDSGATWGDTIADPSEGATQDQYFGLPGWNSDTSDEMIIFVDASANGLSVKRYDDSGDTWAETAIIADGSFVDATAGGSFPHVACAVDLANSRNIVACWNAVDAANQDLRVFLIDDTTVTETDANAVLNATDDCGLCAFGIDTDTGTWYVFYAGKSDGSQTWSSSVTINYKTSTDSGATWSSETPLTTITRATAWLATTPRFATRYLTAFMADYTPVGSDNITVSVAFPTTTASNVFGPSVIT